MRKIKLVLIAILVFSILFGCTQPTSNLEPNNSTKDNDKNVFEEHENIENAEYIISEGADESFKEMDITNLKKHMVYILGDTANVVLQFNDNVKGYEVVTAREYVIKVFVLRRAILSYFPYVEAMNHNYKNVDFIIYIENDKIVREKYDYKEHVGFEINYYENLNMELNSRIIKNEILSGFVSKVKLNYWTVKDVIFEKTFKGTVLAVKIKRDKGFKQEEIAFIQSLIEKDLASNISYRGIVLQLHSKDGIIYEKTYHNGTSKHWFNEDWGNHNYFDFDK